MLRYIQAFSLLANVAYAQAPNASDQVQFLTQAITALQAQRNTAEDNMAKVSAQLAIAQAQLAQTLSENADLKKKLEPPKADATPVPPSATTPPIATPVPPPPMPAEEK